eukprot:TCALIF_09963-PA protein Name:"Protein of unknown function" AED:0.90 eAED:0.90 QI:0/0/0/0.33/1/1/3/0/62
MKNLASENGICLFLPLKCLLEKCVCLLREQHCPGYPASNYAVDSGRWSLLKNKEKNIGIQQQ